MYTRILTTVILAGMLAALSLPAVARAALTVRHYNNWSTAGGSIDFSGATKVFEGVDPNVIDHWDGDRFYLWQPVAGVPHNYGVEWSGFVRIDLPGQYGFGTISDDGSEVWIDGNRIVANHELQWYDWEDNISEGNTSGETFPPLVLSQGYHSITVRFYEQLNYAGIELWWLKPGSGPSNTPWYGTNFHGVAPTFNPATNWQLIPATNLFTAIPAVPGDFDSDGDVDGADFVAWQTNFPKPAGAVLAQGDADGDGDVDGADFVVWQTNFPYPPLAGQSPVPEPAAWIIALFAVNGWAIGRGRTR